NGCGVDAELAIGIGNAYAIAQQSACEDVFAKLVDGRQSLPPCETDDPVTPCVEIGIGCNQQRVGAPLDERREAGVEFRVGAGLGGDEQPLPDTACRLLDLLQLARGRCEVRVD